MTDANNNGKFAAKQVKKGDLIRSADWNDAIKEIERLGNTTSYLDNNDFKGQLTIEEALNVKGNVDIGTKDNQTEVKIDGNLTVNGAISGNIDATNITSGKLAVERIPNLSADKITGGTINDNLTVSGSLSVGVSVGSITNIDLSGHVQLKEYGTNNLAYLQARDDSSNRNIGLKIRTQKQGTSKPILIDALTIHSDGNLNVSGTISGNIDATNITSGKLAVERIPNLSADKITSGELAVARIPNLSADKITSGTIKGDLTVEGILRANFFKAGEGYSATVEAGKWYRIAQDKPRQNRASAEFTLRDYISSGGHSTLTFRVGISYNDAAGMCFTVLNHNKYQKVTFTKVRVLQKNTYDKQYLEVYVNRTGSVDYSIYDNLQKSGWEAVNWAEGSIPDGYSSREFEVDRLFVVGDYEERFSIARGGNLEVTGTAKLNNVFVGDVGHSSNWAGFSHKSSIGKESYALLQSSNGNETLLNTKSGGSIRFRIDNQDQMIMDKNGYFTINKRLYVKDVPKADRKNMQWDSGSGLLYHDDSSRKNKENIIPLKDDFSKILEVEPKTYTRPNIPDNWEIGYIAEEFHELGLNTLIYYENDGTPGAINYRKISMYLIEIIKEMSQKINNYEQRINQLEQKI